MVIRILSHWTRYFLPLSVSDSIWDIERVVYLELSSLLVRFGLICRMSCCIVNYLIFLAGEIKLDLQNNKLLGIILFPLSMGFDL